MNNLLKTDKELENIACLFNVTILHIITGIIHKVKARSINYLIGGRGS